MSTMIEAWRERNVRETFAEAARTFADLVRRLPPDRWDGPGLGEWNVRALVGHTSRALVTVETYLGQPADTEDVPTPAAYYLATAGIDHAAVVNRGVKAGRELGEDPAEFLDALAERVLLQLDTAGNPLIHTVAGGMQLESYLPTRTLELVVHSLDIAAAAPNTEPPAFSDQLLAEVARVAAHGRSAARARRRADAGPHRPSCAQPGFQHRLTLRPVSCTHRRRSRSSAGPHAAGEAGRP
jgi:Mycothiol maleylpyruvate isomerase N-terminal domain